MAYTFADRNKKIVLHSWGRFRASVLADVVVGDLLGLYSDPDDSMQLANEAVSSVGAIAVAVEDIAAGETGWCALAAELKAPTTLGTGGVATQTYFDDGSGKDIGQDLYLNDAGKVSDTIGSTTKQRVGYNMSRDRILLVPGGSITNAAGSFTTLAASAATTLSTTLSVAGVATLSDATESTNSTSGGTIITGGLGAAKDIFVGEDLSTAGNVIVVGDTDATNSTSGSLKTAGGLGVAKKLYVGTDLDVGVNATIDGTLTQTGVATFAAAPVFDAGATITADQFISGAPIKMLITTKNDNATLTTAEAGIILVTVDAKLIQLPAVSGNSGLRYIIKSTASYTSGTTIDPNASETIDGDTDPNCGAQYDMLDIVCDGTAWHTIGKIGSWT